MSGTVERFDNRFIYVNLGSIEAQLSGKTKFQEKCSNLMIELSPLSIKLKITHVVVNVFDKPKPSEMIKRFMEQEIS